MHPDNLIGATLGSYRVTAKLGQGGMGAVYLAEHPVLGRKAAVKVLLPELSEHGEAVDRFFHEARTTANLRHPAMVDVFDFGTLPDGRAYLIMDFLEGESLQSRLENGGVMALGAALDITRQIALGMSAAHAEKIVHRDLKPDNVFLLPAVAGTGGERVKILDFGIAKLTHKGEGNVAVTRTGMLLGTPLYMSPEQCRGTGDVDHRADLYSLGCMLFTMLSGRPPFLSEGMGELLGLHLHAPPPTLAEVGAQVPTEVEALVARTLAKAPADRFPSMLALAEAIGGLASWSGPGALRGTAVQGAAGIGASIAHVATSASGGTKVLGAAGVGVAAVQGTRVLLGAGAVGKSTLSEAAGASHPVETGSRGRRLVTVVAFAVAVLLVGGGTLFFALRDPGPAPAVQVPKGAFPTAEAPAAARPTAPAVPPVSAAKEESEASLPSPAEVPAATTERIRPGSPSKRDVSRKAGEQTLDETRRKEKRQPAFGRTKLQIDTEVPY